MSHISRFFSTNPIRVVSLALGFTLLISAQNAFPTLGITEAASSTAAPQASLVGAWSFPFGMPTVPIHTSVLPNGKVLIWGRDKVNNADIANSTGVWIYDPSLGSFTSVANSTTNLFCSGHSFLPDGSLLVTGGHDGRDGFGEPDTNVFNYNTNAWSLVAPMNQGRWYPSTCALGNGDVAVVAGQYWDGTFVDPPNNQIPHIVNNTLPQVWQTSLGGGWRNLTTAQRATALYPFLMLAPSGKIFSAGPSNVASYLSTSGTGAWADIPPPTSQIPFRDWGTAVMYDDGKVMITGGGPPTALTEVIDLNISSPISQTILPVPAVPVWANGGSMLTARKQLNATILADGKVLVTGGTSTAGFNDYPGHVQSAEMWDPETQQWGATAMASAFVPRIYHSTAVLMPDGSVLVAGGGRPAGDNGEPTGGQPQSVFGHFDGEFFYPPYFFKGARPTISSAPSSLNHGQQFFVATPDAASITRVTLIRLSSVTHAFNESQRINYLSFQKTPTGLNVTPPGGNNLCPPGYYMLFILNSNGVPSVASIVQVTVPTSKLKNSIDDQQYFVRMHYEDFLGRGPDRSGLDFWTGQITQCGNDPVCIGNKRVDVARAFWESGEFQSQHQTDGLLTPGGPSEYNSTEFVRWNYRQYLRRQPDASGLSFWTNSLNSCLAPNPANGQCYNNTIKAFIISGEYKNRFNQP